MKFRPLHDRIVVRRVDEETKSTGGIIIPDTAKEKPQEGEIIAVGPGARDESGKLVPVVEAVTLEELDQYKRSQLNQVVRTDLLIMKESDILGIVD